MCDAIRNLEKGVKESEQRGRNSQQNGCVLCRDAASDTTTKARYTAPSQTEENTGLVTTRDSACGRGNS